ncbi:MAG: ATP-binding protein [candidate division FCPU426 bacterium]
MASPTWLRHFFPSLLNRLRDIRPPLKLRNQLLSVILILVTFNFIFFALLAMRTRVSYVAWETERALQHQAGELGRFTDEYFMEIIRRMHADLSKLKITDIESPEKFQSDLDPWFRRFPSLQAISLLNARQAVVAYALRQHQDLSLVDVKDQHLLRLAGDTSDVWLGKAEYLPTYGRLVLPVLFLLHPQKFPAGGWHLRASLNFTEFILELSKYHLPSETEIVLVNSEGKILLHPRLPPGRQLGRYQQLIHELLSRRQHAGVSPQVFQVAASENDQGERVLRAYAYCANLGWGLFLEQNAAIIPQRINRQRLLLAGLLLGPLILTLMVSLGVVVQLTRPLEELEAGIKLFEAGLLFEPLPIHGQDEIGRLTMAFNQMVHTLVARNEEIQNKTRKLLFFNEITSIINQSIDLRTFLNQALRKILQNLSVSAGWIYIFDPQVKKLNLLAHFGLTEQQLSWLKSPDFTDALQKKLYSTGKPSLWRDLSRQLELDHARWAELLPDLLLVPLRSKKRTVGVLALTTTHKYFSQYKEMDQLIRIGGELGIAVENALLYIELQLKIKERDEVNRELQEMDRFKDHILSNVSHELRTPITSIRSYTDLFLAGKIGPLSDVQKDKLAIIQRNVNHLLVLINDLLTMSKMQDQKLLLKHRETMAIQEAVDQVLADTREMARAKNLKLARTGESKPIYIRVNIQKMYQVLQNLVSNAIKFTEQGSVTVDIKLAAGGPTGRQVEISVTDTGIGIPPEAHDKIYQRFYQVDSSSTRKYVGTGLGLAIVKELLEAHGTEIKLESRVGEGSRFWFRLPVEEAPKINQLPNA